MSLTHVCHIDHLGECLVVNRHIVEHYSTIKIMDEFTEYYRYVPRYQHLVIMVAMDWCVIVGRPHSIKVEQRGDVNITMTNFRKRDPKYWEFYEALSRNVDHRDFTEYSVDTGFFKGSLLLYTKNIPTLRAMTTYDRDYGDEWRGGYCVKEGNKYGDTTSFPVVGELRGWEYSSIYDLPPYSKFGSI